MNGENFYIWQGKKYFKKWYIYRQRQEVTSANQYITDGVIALLGNNPFVLSTLSRTVVSSTGLELTTFRFLFRLGTTRNTEWYSSGGVGSTQDEVIDTCIFGANGSFPKIIRPNIVFEPNGAITYTVRDLGQGATPYSIHMAFEGWLLLNPQNV